MKNIKKKYTNGEITILWQPNLCIHAGVCFSELPQVFDLSERPWIKMDKATTKEIIDVVQACPTDALTYTYNEQPADEMRPDKLPCSTKIKIITDGPFIVEGSFELFDEKGNQIITERRNALCRCGASRISPFCDGNHRNINFKDEPDYS